MLFLFLFCFCFSLENEHHGVLLETPFIFIKNVYSFLLVKLR